MFSVIEVVLQSKLFKFFISFLGAFYLWFMVISPFFDGWNSVLITWKNWQTFNAAVIAFISTLIIIHSTRISEQNKAIRKRNAAKAFMPSALAEIYTYVEDLINLLDDLHLGNKEFKLDFRPQISELALQRIEKFIQESSLYDQKLIEHLVIVINTIQVFDSRITSILSDDVMSNKKERAFYQINQCVLLHSLISGMFDFTRSITDVYDLTYLSSEKFAIKNCSFYMTEPEIDKYKKSEIEFNLFVSS
ncbi:MAG: hypothetical protein KAH18_04770 [Psychromonas sp.]|nr:hypothetical protein [Psychromonas sp.]